MQSIAAYFIKRRRMANLILILIVLTGILSAISLRRQGYPAIDFNIMKITTEYPGASPEDVEINVTDAIEDELKEVEDIDEIRSLSMENISLIFVYISPDASDTKRVKGDIRDAVDRVSDLPAEVTDKPKVEEIRTTNTPVMEISITGDVSEKELREYAKALEDEIKAAKGIGVIEKVGYNKREIKIEVDQKRIEDRYVSLGEIMDSIRSRNVRTSGGSLQSYISEKKIVTFAEYQDPLEVKDVIIRSTFTGQMIKISDVALVEDSFEEPKILSRANGDRAISIVVRPQEKADVITLSNQVKKYLSDFQKELPENVHATLMYDNSVYTRSLLSMVSKNAIMGFALVLVVMFVFLDWKTAFWTAFGLPIAILAALIFFEPLGVTINFITLSAMILVLGILVDDAIVIAEKVYQYKEAGGDPVSSTIEGVRSVFLPVVAAVATTVLAFVPMFFMSGMTGKFITSIPIVVMLMLGFSLLESTLFLPSHIVHVMPPQKPPRRAMWISKFKEFYHRRVMWCLRNRKKVLISYICLCTLIFVASFVWLKFVLFPQEDPDIYNIVVEAPRGTPLYETEELVSQVEKILDEVVPPEVMDSYVTRIGHHDTNVYGGSAGQYENWGLITVYLKPAEDRERPSEELSEELNRRFKKIIGLKSIVVEPMDDGPPIGKPVTVIYVSDNDGLRDRFEKETIDFLSSIEGVFGIESTNVLGKDELRLILDYEQMAKLGITALDVSRTVRAAFEGDVVTSIRREGEEIDYRVSLKDPKKYQAEGVLKLSIANKNGNLVPLKNFAHFEETQSSAVIRHYDGKRSVTVTAEVDNDVITALEANNMVRDRFEDEVKKHAGFKMELGGEQKRVEESMHSFYFALSIALIAIYFLLVVLFDSFVQPLLIMSAIPFALIGVFLTFMVHGLPLGFIAMIGILGLVGVVVNDTIVMVSHLNKTCAKNGNSFSIISQAAADRFRPVILTTLTTAAGLMPTAYGIGGDLPFIRPMVLSLAWGLIFATLVSLIFIPLIYSFYTKVKLED